MDRHADDVSDQRLRELEAAWRASGSVEDEAEYLFERVRLGELSEERLELAALLGHEAARRLTTKPIKPADGLEDLLERLLEASFPVVHDCLKALFLVSRVYGRGAPESLLEPRPEEIHSSVREVAALLGEDFTSPPVEHPRAEDVTGACWTVSHLCKSGRTGSEALRAGLVPWALGYSDPVRERVEARQREAARE